MTSVETLGYSQTSLRDENTNPSGIGRPRPQFGGRGQIVEKSTDFRRSSSDTQLDLWIIVGGAVHELMEIGPGALRFAQVQTLGNLFDGEGRLLPQTSGQRQHAL